MGRSEFRKGALVGAAAVLVMEAVFAAALLGVWMVATGDEEPDPTATRREVSGTVTQTELRVCVEALPDAAPEAPTELWCGFADRSLSSGATVGDVVDGTIIEVELDPGSGTAWSVWESLTPTAG